MARRVMLVSVDALQPGATTFATFNPADKAAGVTLSGGNLVMQSNDSFNNVRSTLSMSSGRHYFEFQNTVNATAAMIVGIALASASLTGSLTGSTSWTIYSNFGTPSLKYPGGTSTGLAILPQGQVAMVAVDCDIGAVWFGHNGVWENGANPARGLNPSFTFTPGTTMFAAASASNAAQVITANFGASAFAHTVPDGFRPGLYAVGAPTTVPIRMATEAVLLNDGTLHYGRLRTDLDPYREVDVECWPWGGNSSRSAVGELRFNNADRRLDSWRDLIFRDRVVTVRYGTLAEIAADTFTTWGIALVDRHEFGASDVSLVLSDFLARFDRPGQPSTYPSTVAVTTLRDQARPFCLGEAANVDPVMVSTANRVYDVSDDVIAGVTAASDQADPDILGTDYRLNTSGFRRLVNAVGKVAATVRGNVKRTSSFLSEQFTGWAAAGAFDNNPDNWTVVGEASAAERIYQKNTGRCTWLKSGGAAALTLERNLGFTTGNLYALRINVSTFVAGELRFFTRTTAGVRSAELFRIDTTNGAGVQHFCFTPAASHVWLVIEMPAATTGEIEADWIEVENASLIERLPDWLEALCTRAGLAAGDRDTTAITALDTAAPYALNYYARAQFNLKDLLRQTMDSFCGWAYGDRLGKLSVGRLQEPATTAVLTLSRDDLVDDWTCILDQAKGLSSRLGALRNWTQHGDSDFATSVGEPVRQSLKAVFQEIRGVTGVVESTYSHADKAPVQPSLLRLAADAFWEIGRVIWLYRKQRFFYRGSAILDETAVLTLKPGDTVRIVYNKFDLASGKNLVVKRIRPSFFSRRVGLTLWG